MCYDRHRKLIHHTLLLQTLSPLLSALSPLPSASYECHPQGLLSLWLFFAQSRGAEPEIRAREEHIYSPGFCSARSRGLALSLTSGIAPLKALHGSLWWCVRWCHPLHSPLGAGLVTALLLLAGVPALSLMASVVTHTCILSPFAKQPSLDYPNSRSSLI